MPSSFFTGLSGLQTHSRAIDVLANNLANLNTFGFKRSRAEFKDLFYQQIGRNRAGLASQVGLGVAPLTVSKRFEQGTIQSTGGVLDAAIQGEGFFIVKDNDLEMYSRAGNFQLNLDKQLITLDGQVIQGWVRNTAGLVDTTQPITGIQLASNEKLPPVPTSFVRIAANLTAAATVGPPATVFTAPVQIFDSLGDSHVINITFTRAAVSATPGAASTWDVDVTLPDTDVNTPPTTPTVSILDTGPMQVDFDASGNLILPGGTAPYTLAIDMTNTVNGALTLANGAQPLQISWDLLDPQGQPALTSFVADSAVFDVSQDGSASADLVSISIADGGVLEGQYDDGRSLALAQIALARFNNPQTLLANGNNNYLATGASGTPIRGEANQGGRGGIIGLSLESSNVDIAQEFTGLLTFQRGFQANSRVITTADELNQEALNLKR